MSKSADLDAACEVLHDAYEAAAAKEGWETQERSRKPWEDVPEANKATMRAAVGVLLDHLAAARPAIEREAKAERDSLAARLAAVEVLTDECANSGCIHLNNMCIRLCAALATEATTNPQEADQ